jgi:predicted AlkP superfamily phosphohydrolase/phosphomutase
MARDRPFPNVVCVGLDGATFDVIDPLVAEGRLPTLGRLLTSGTRARLRSTVPPLSAPAWVTFMTGTGPGTHGIFHFRTMERGVLGPDLVGPWAYRGTTIFDHASSAGVDVAAIRVPMTYPAWEINGVMVSGFPTPDPRRNFSVPEQVGRDMPSLFTLSPTRSMVASLGAQVENFDHYLDRSTAWLIELLRDRPPTFFCYVNSVTDWAAHKLWRFSDPQAPAYEPHPVQGKPPLEYVYERVDASLGAILDAAPEDALVVVLSDHGTGRRSARRFHPNAWLAELGLVEHPESSPLRRSAAKAFDWASNAVPKKYWLWRHAPRSVRSGAGKVRDYGQAVDLGRSSAYGVHVDHHLAGVNVNLAGREPSGTVPQAEYEAVRDRVVAAAVSLVDPATGRRVIRAADRREELFSGEHVDGMPDVVLQIDEAFEVGHGAGRTVLASVERSAPGRSSATHRPDGILVVSGPGVRRGVDLGEANLIDVPETLLWALGLAVPARMEGEVVTGAFEEALVRAHPVRREEGAVATGETQGYTHQEEEEMTAHLEELGYL